MLTFPAEVFPELWLADDSGASLVQHAEEGDFYGVAPVLPPFRALVPPDRVAVALNQANDGFGYIIPVSQWDYDPPCAYVGDEGPQYGEELSVGPSAGPILFEAFANLLVPSAG